MLGRGYTSIIPSSSFLFGRGRICLLTRSFLGYNSAGKVAAKAAAAANITTTQLLFNLPPLSLPLARELVRNFEKIETLK